MTIKESKARPNMNTGVSTKFSLQSNRVRAVFLITGAKLNWISIWEKSEI